MSIRDRLNARGAAMKAYQITDPRSGRTLELISISAPTPAEQDTLFSEFNDCALAALAERCYVEPYRTWLHYMTERGMSMRTP